MPLQIDPNLARTVVVGTKFDTKLPQFARGNDVETFLHPNLGLGEANALRSNGAVIGPLGNSPFFTSVPSGRVGKDQDSVFPSNEDFRSAVSSREVSSCSHSLTVFIPF